MRSRVRQRGEGQLGCIMGLIILVAAVFLGYKMIPIKMRAAEVRQVMYDESKSAGTHGDERIRKAIVVKAIEVDLPITPESIKITRNANQIHIVVSYVVPVQFPGFVYQWHFEHEAENPIF